MIQHEGTRPEVMVREKLTLTPESLKEDNQTPKARELFAKYEQNKENGNLWAVVTCGDARCLVPNPENIDSIRSIATGGKKEKKIFESPGVKLVIVMTHIDGATISSGKKPKGCGGAAAKEEAINGNNHEAIEGIQYYIEKNINHPDPIIQAAITANEITRQTGKPSLAVVQDHRTGKIYPFAALMSGYDLVSSKLDWVNLSKRYDEAKIYADGIPTLPESIIPEVFKDYINASKEYMAEMLRTYPNLSEIQETQNPRMVFISSKLASARTRYPELTKYPNSLFKLHLPREKEGTRIEITPDMQNEIINQAQYPLEHAVKHFGQQNASFSRTDRVLIETSDINVSKSLAQEMSKRDWMQKWLSLPDHKIIVIQNIAGISNQIEYFPKE